jgi:hypothetical protein
MGQLKAIADTLIGQLEATKVQAPFDQDPTSSKNYLHHRFASMAVVAVDVSRLRVYMDMIEKPHPIVFVM